MTNRIFDSVTLITYRANGDIIDRCDYDGTISAVSGIAEDVFHFEQIWEIGESYKILVNGIEVTNVDHFMS